MIGIPRAWGGGLLGRTDKGEKCKDEMTTLPTTVESKIDKHRLIMYVFAFNYRRKLINLGSTLGSRVLKVDEIIVRLFVCDKRCHVWVLCASDTYL